MNKMHKSPKNHNVLLKEVIYIKNFFDDVTKLLVIIVN